MLWIVAASVSRLPSSTLTFPDKKNDLGVMSGVARLGLEIFGTFPVLGGFPPPGCRCALSVRARKRNTIRRTGIRDMVGPPCLAIVRLTGASRPLPFCCRNAPSNFEATLSKGDKTILDGHQRKCLQ